MITIWDALVLLPTLFVILLALRVRDTGEDSTKRVIFLPPSKKKGKA